MWYIYSLFGILLRRQVFDVNEGNDDWRDLVHPEKYGLTQTQNFYIPVMFKKASSVTSSHMVCEVSMLSTYWLVDTY